MEASAEAAVPDCRLHTSHGRWFAAGACIRALAERGKVCANSVQHYDALSLCKLSQVGRQGLR